MSKVSMDLPASASSAHTARQFVRQALLGWGGSHIIEPATLMASELVTNAIQYSQTDSDSEHPIAVRVLTTPYGVRIEVDDECDTVPLQRDATDEGGRGLTIVDTMSTAWGTRTSQNGKTVWFELER